MSLRTDITAAMASVAGGNVFWLGTVPEEQAAPYVVLQVIFSDPQNELDGEVTNLANTRLQMDCWASTVGGAETVADAAIAAMDAATAFKKTVINDFDAFEPNRKLKGRTLEFSIWNN